jgi:flagellar protein FlaG
MSIPGIASSNEISKVSRMSETANTPESGKRQIVSTDGKALPPTGQAEVTQEEIAEAVRDISTYMQSMSRELQFQLDDSSATTVITVTDPETSEVVRQIPTEEVVAIARYIAEIAPDPLRGLLVDGQE